MLDRVYPPRKRDFPGETSACTGGENPLKHGGENARTTFDFRCASLADHAWLCSCSKGDRVLILWRVVEKRAGTNRPSG